MPNTPKVRCDHAARDPYEAHSSIDIQSAPVEFGRYIYELGTVPVGKRLVVEYLSAAMPIGSSITPADLPKAAATLSHDHAQFGAPHFNLDIPFTSILTLNNTSGDVLLLSQSITLYAPPGAKVRLLVTPHPEARGVEVYATGRYIRL